MKLASTEDVWDRIIISERRSDAPLSDVSGPPDGFLLGETEGYFLQYADTGDGGIRAGGDGGIRAVGDG